MGKAMFYHLTRSPLEVALPVLLQRSLAAGWRVVVRGGDAERLRWLDERLWLAGDDAGFLPHGLAGGPHDADQPVLLTVDRGFPNAAACLICIDRAPLDPDEAAGLERACLMFDGADPAATEAARDRWRALAAAGLPAEYWSEASGQWRKERG